MIEGRKGKRSFLFCATSEVTSEGLPLRTGIRGRDFEWGSWVASVLEGGTQQPPVLIFIFKTNFK